MKIARTAFGKTCPLQERLAPPDPVATRSFYGIVTRNREMDAVFRYVEAVARSWQPVLISGETGAGKELVAQALHDLSGCRGSFVPVNVAGLDDTMFSDTLFGHRKGAYTGAQADREGLMAQAQGGTLFLDEIGDLEIRSQLKLLRLLEEKEYYPLGSDTPQKTDARIVCATNRNLMERAQSGEFRKDLFYRLSAHRIHLPPLRERTEDIPLLADHYLEESAQALGKSKPTAPPELNRLLSAYHFPGNVRELRAMIFDAVAQHRSGVLSLDSFKRTIARNHCVPSADPPGGSAGDGDSPFALLDRVPTLKEAEEKLIDEALRRSGNNQSQAALLLGMTREGLNKWLTRRRKLAGREPYNPKAA